MGDALTTAQRANILDAATGEPLSNARYLATVDGPAAGVLVDGDNNLDLVGNAEGSVVLTVTDTTTGAVATLPVTVAVPPFQVTLGTPEPK